MVKNIFVTFSILLSISLMFFISLSSGIRLGDFSYENVSIKGLYLKYDEKIIIDTQNVLIYNKDRTKSTQFRIKFSIESFFDQYYIHVENFFLTEPFLKVSGDIVVDPKNINLDTISELYFNNFSIQFSRNLKPVLAQKCFVKYENNSFHFTFLNPMYGDVSIKDSSVSINDYDHVMLNIQSKEKLTNEVLELLSNYKVNVPVKQIEGTNQTEVKVKLPFDIKEDIDVHSKIDLANGKILLYDIPLYVDSLKINLDNNILKGKGKLLKAKRTDEKLLYNIDNHFEIDFRKNQVVGEFHIIDGFYESLLTTDTNGSFLLDFDKEFFADIQLDPNSFMMIKDELFVLKNFSSHYQNSTKDFLSTLEAQHLEYGLNLSLKDRFSLESLKSKGVFDLDLKDTNNSFAIKINSAGYDSSFSDKFYLTFNDSDTILEHNDTKMVSKSFQGSFFDEKLHGKLFNTELNSTKNDLFFHTIDLTINGKKDIQISTSSISSLKTELPVEIEDIDIHLMNEKVKYTSTIDKQHTLHGEFDLQKGDTKGVLNYDNELIDFYGNIFDQKSIKVPKLELRYDERSNDEYTLEINNTLFLKHFFKYLTFHKTSSIYTEKNSDTNTTSIHMNNIDLDVLALEEEKKDVSRQKLLRADIDWNNGSFKVGEYSFPFQKTTLQLVSGMASGNMQLPNDGNINIKKDIHQLVIVSNNLTSEYVNEVFQKNYFKDGSFEIFLTKKTIDSYDSYEGVVKIHGVTFKELQFVDNLLLFVNSTPAIINPFLAIPTFLRFGMNGFKIDGYHVVEGSFDFVYHKAKKILDLNNIKMDGNINNFNGEISLDLNDDSLQGQLNVSFLKDFATVLRNIPLVGQITLNKDGDIALPINISGTLEDPSFSVNNK